MHGDPHRLCGVTKELFQHLGRMPTLQKFVSSWPSLVRRCAPCSYYGPFQSLWKSPIRAQAVLLTPTELRPGVFSAFGPIETEISEIHALKEKKNGVVYVRMR